jgi:hypothetical protein
VVTLVPVVWYRFIILVDINMDYWLQGRKRIDVNGIVVADQRQHSRASTKPFENVR